MPYMLSRPAAAFDPGAGLLIAEQFQMAYVTTDIERGLDLLGKRLGIRQFARLEGQMPEGGLIRAEFAWVGTADVRGDRARPGPAPTIYMSRLPRPTGSTSSIITWAS